MDQASVFAASVVALYVGHHVGDYWIQTDHQAQHKGKAGTEGVLNCLLHVLSYCATQVACLLVVAVVVGLPVSYWGVTSAIAVSGGTHYLADRREHGLMFWLVRRMEPVTGKARFMALGVPRASRFIEVWGPCSSCEGRGTSYDESTGGKCWDCRGGGMLPVNVEITDNPGLGTGAWALDQSWHIFWGVFVSALLLSVL